MGMPMYSKSFMSCVSRYKMQLAIKYYTRTLILIFIKQVIDLSTIRPLIHFGVYHRLSLFGYKNNLTYILIKRELIYTKYLPIPHTKDGETRSRFLSRVEITDEVVNFDVNYNHGN